MQSLNGSSVNVLNYVFISSLVLALLLSSCPASASRDIHLKFNLSKPIKNLDNVEINAKLCDGLCKDVQISSLSYSKGSEDIDIFIHPEIKGNFTYEVSFSSDSYSETFTGNIEVEQVYEKVNTDNEITGRMASGESNPLFGLLIVSSLILFGLFRFDNQFFDNDYLDSWFAPSLIFIVTFFLLTTAVHELSHVVALESYSCPYSLSMNIPFGPDSVSIGECSLANYQASMILLSGILGNVILFLSLYLFHTSNSISNSKSFRALVLGVILSPIAYLFHSTGDIHNLVSLAGFTVPQIYFTFSGALLTVTAVWYGLRGWEKVK